MSAFPILSLLQNRDGDYSLEQEGGLTKRELFAAMAMQGYLANPNVDPDTAVKAYAKHSVTYADALIAALEKTND